MKYIIGKNRDEKVIEKIKGITPGIAVIVYGSGEVAMHVTKELQTYGIQVDDYAVDAEYLSQAQDALTPEELDKKYKSYILLIGYLGGYRLDGIKIIKDSGKFHHAVYIDYISFIPGDEYVERPGIEYYKKDEKRFDGLYSDLQDDFSKKSLFGYINARINRDDSYIMPYVVLPQYVPYKKDENKLDDFVQLTDHECFLDCGAYTGDTIRDFIKVTNGKYHKIIACEPDEGNRKMLSDYVKKAQIDNIIIVNRAVYDEKKKLHFSFESSIFARESDNAKGRIVEADTIDNIVADQKVTYVAMDIEGSEMKALKGAQEVILRDKPVLAISCYHKAADPVDIYEYLKSLVPEYKFYFRMHKPILCDSVLYATIR